MPDEFDELQERIIEDERMDYSETVIDHAMNPRNIGGMKGADGFARFDGPCGDTMEIWIKVDKETITESRFMTDGCGTSLASGSMVTEMATGKSIDEARKISAGDVLTALGGLPQDSEHCAALAASTLKAAIRDYIVLKREPWRKAYRG